MSNWVPVFISCQETYRCLSGLMRDVSGDISEAVTEIFEDKKSWRKSRCMVETTADMAAVEAAEEMNMEAAGAAMRRGLAGQSGAMPAEDLLQGSAGLMRRLRLAGK